MGLVYVKHFEVIKMKGMDMLNIVKKQHTSKADKNASEGYF